MMVIKPDDYAQKKREEAVGLYEPRKAVFKRSPPPKGKSMTEEIRAAMAKLAEDEADIVGRELSELAMRMSEERLARDAAIAAKIEPKVIPARGAGDLDYQMGEFMMGTHGVKVEKEYHPADERCLLYRFFDPSTGEHYCIYVDERIYRSRQEEIDHKWAMMDEVMHHFKAVREKKTIAEWEKDGKRYTDADGRTFVKEIPKAPIHREGHFPTHWVEEALDRAEASDKCVTLTMERKGVMVVATEGDDKYSSHVITWAAMEYAEVNPLPLAIADCEKKLDLLSKIKAKVK